MHTVTSADGTRIAVDRSGAGPALVLVSGALGSRLFPEPLVPALEPHFTVYSYDRRGRNDSGDNPPYAVGREIEDLAAVIEDAGGSAFLHGMSSGAVLALRAAAAGLPVTQLTLYEPPFLTDDSRPPLPDDYVQRLDELIAAGQRGEAVTYFMTMAVGVPEEFLGPLRESPMWPGMEAVAHTLAYDGRVMGDTMSGKPLPAEWSSVTVPTTVIAGERSEPFMHRGTQALADLLPNAVHRVLPGQDHNVDPAALAPVLRQELLAPQKRS
ncbi:alpha/beta hydrolase [Streptomyces sp. ACA25]|nr:alpha/beta hydrolase [Streptomyces sp. ACA25]MDB1087019.1 alpha/beta hydrolase [Streptomyces sp. ACA25]